MARATEATKVTAKELSISFPANISETKLNEKIVAAQKAKEVNPLPEPEKVETPEPTKEEIVDPNVPAEIKEIIEEETLDEEDETDVKIPVSRTSIHGGEPTQFDDIEEAAKRSALTVEDIKESIDNQEATKNGWLFN